MQQSAKNIKLKLSSISIDRRVANFLTSLFLLFSCTINAATLQGKVVSIADGDTITVLDANNKQHKIRLHGIDAPEKAQAFGQKSKQSLHQLINKKEVTVEFEKKTSTAELLARSYLMALTYA